MWGLLLGAASAAFGVPAGHAAFGQCGETVVQVVLDLDAAIPGFQSSVTIPPGSAVVEGISVWVLDPLQSACVWGIGYVGGIDRGIALGHVPDESNGGSVVDLIPAPGAPVNPGNVGFAFGPPGLQRGFAGPEVQYVEAGARSAWTIPAIPEEPIFSVDVVLADPVAGDVFALHLLDMVVVWSKGIGGAFSTQGFLTLDTGGDAVPDLTQTLYGVDPDVPIPVPPAAYPVDYVDGPPGGGPATIIVVAPGDLDVDGLVGITDLLLLLAAWGPCPGPPLPCAADLDGDGTVGITDLLVLLGNWS
jgi:hypothetical protein